jgi:hypothetical protein
VEVDYLEGPLRARFEHWLDEGVRLYSAELEFREIRKGVQALSTLYVERRDEAPFGGRPFEGRGKRAAQATYFGPLHFLAVHHALAEFGAEDLADVRRVLDLGCGTGATGAALASTLTSRPPLLGLDRSGWALGEARRAWTSFGLRGRVRRGVLPAALPELRPGDLLALGWTVNELDDTARDKLLDRLDDALERGCGLFVAEPLSTRVSPWWPQWEERLGARGAQARVARLTVIRPPWIERLDRASALDHRTIGARALLAAPRSERRSTR